MQRDPEMEHLITALRCIADEPERFDPKAIQWYTDRAASALREAHPLTGGPPHTLCTNQLSTYDFPTEGRRK